MIEFLSYLRIVIKILLFFIISIRLLSLLMYYDYYTNVESTLSITLLIILSILVFIPDKTINRFFYYGVILIGIVTTGFLIQLLIVANENPLFESTIGICIIILLSTYILSSKKENSQV